MTQAATLATRQCPPRAAIVLPVTHGAATAYRADHALLATVGAAEVFPGVPLTRDAGTFGTLLAIGRARRILGYEPGHSWRDAIEG